MRKRLYVLCAAFILSCVIFSPLTASFQESQLPRLSSSDIQYLGGFRLPRATVNGSNFEFGGRPLAFNPAGPSLFVSSRDFRVAEVSIPTPVNSSDINALPFASYLQGFADPTEGHLGEIGTDGLGLGGLIVQGGKLYGTGWIYFDALNTQRVSHYSHSLQLSQSSFVGWSSVWDAAKTGYVSGYLATIPSEWQVRLGGPTLTGQCCIPIVSRTSFGPDAFAFDASKIGQSVVPAAPLLYYPGDHPTLGPWEGSNEWYGMSAGIGGVAVVSGTRTALFVGRNGMGAACYGTGTSNQSLAGTPVGDGSIYCYDPTNNYKAVHAYPYRYQIWAYDLDDFAAVKAGTKQPWDVVPYGVWPIEFPIAQQDVSIGGVGYDPQKQLLYVAQINADPDGDRPIIHAFQLNASRADGSLPPPTTTEPASPVVTSVTVAANRAAPQPPGTTVNFQAAASGGATPRQYKWLTTTDDLTWSTASDWNTTTLFAWTPTTAGQYKVRVWARSATSTVDQPEAITTIAYSIAAPNSNTVSSVMLSANRVAPQAPMTGITFTATPVGGVGPHQYKYRVFDGASWTVVADWSPTNSFTWTPGTANTNYRLEVWVRSANNNADVQEASSAMNFPIQTASAPVTAPVTGVAISANRVSPQSTGTAITWTAVPSGGAGPIVYRWFVIDGSGQTWAGDWTSNANFTWSPGVAGTYRIMVWAKSANDPADQSEARIDTGFTIFGSPTAVTPPPEAPKPTAPDITPPAIPTAISTVTVTSDKGAPQLAGASVVFAAQASGGVAPYQYKWRVFDGTTWVVSATWSQANTFTWTPTVPNANYRVEAWARSSGNTNDQPEAASAVAFPIDANTIVGAPVSSVALSANMVEPQPVGTTITWSALAAGGTGPYLYKWYVIDGYGNAVGGDWSTNSTFIWAPAVASRYRVMVWVKNASDTADQSEARIDKGFTIQPR